MKNLVLLMLVSKGLVRCSETSQEFRKGFLFAFQVNGTLYAVYNDEAVTGAGKVETAMHIYTYNGGKGIKRTEKVFSCNKYRKGYIMAFAEAARLLSSVEGAPIIVSDEGKAVIEWREKQYQKALAEGTLQEFAQQVVTTVKVNSAGETDEKEFAPVSEIRQWIAAQALTHENAAD